jgi:hypothetical protein
VRRLLILLLFALMLVGGAAVTWQAMGRAKLVQEDLTTARSLLARAGGFESGELKGRLALVDRAEQHTLSAQQRLGRWPLRQLGALPLVGRDVRVAKAVASSATGTVRATRKVVTALQPVQTHPPTRASIQQAADALLGLHDTLRQDLERVRATRPLLTASSRTRYLEAAGSASTTAERAGQGLKLAAGLYGPPGSARWFLAFQNPADPERPAEDLEGQGPADAATGSPPYTPTRLQPPLPAGRPLLLPGQRRGVRLPASLRTGHRKRAVQRAAGRGGPARARPGHAPLAHVLPQ